MRHIGAVHTRARTWIVPIAGMLGILAALLPSVLQPRPAFAASGSIASYISRAGDQVVTVPNGTYTGGGTINAPHPATTGRYKGWLVLVAQSKGGVIVDLSTSNLTLGPSTSRVLFVGFKFVNGMFVVQGDDITFWYTEHTFPPEEWNRQYQAAGSDMLAMQNPVPKGLWVGQGANRVVRRISVLGADVHDITDDGLFFGGTQGDTVAGTRIWNVDHKGYDPPSPWRPGSDSFHNDSIQVPGGVSDLTVSQSSLGQMADIGGDNGDSTNLKFDNLWITGSPMMGFDFYVQNGWKITGSMRTIRAWGNGWQHPGDNGYNTMRVDFVDAEQWIYPTMTPNTLLQIVDAGGNLNRVPPPGMTITGDHTVDQATALASAQNPANVWRASHSYTSWPALFGQAVPTGTGSAPRPAATTTTSRARTTTTTRPTTTTITTAARPTSTVEATTTTTAHVPGKTREKRPAHEAAAPAVLAVTTSRTTVPRSLRIIDGVEWLPITKEDVLPVVRVAAGKQNDGFLYGAAVLALGIVLVPRRLVRRRRRRARSLG